MAPTHELKFTPPQLPSVIARPRLLKLLDDHRDRRLTLIVGQAAQGKSTLGAMHAATLKTPSAWVRLDSDDSDPTNLYYALAFSLQRIFPDVDFQPQLAIPAAGLGPRDDPRKPLPG